MSVELLYRVVHLSQVGPSVRLILQEVRTVPPEEIERASLESPPELETDVVAEGGLLKKIDFAPKPKTQMEEMFSAMRTQFPELTEIFGPSFPGKRGGGVMMRAVPISQQIEVFFTPEQYRELGSPPLLSTIRIAMSVE